MAFIPPPPKPSHPPAPKSSHPPSHPSKTSTPSHVAPSPKTQRSLRHFKSTSALGSISSTQPGLITQQRNVQRKMSQAQLPLHPAHGRSSGDVRASTPLIGAPATPRTPGGKKMGPADALSLERLIREGPPNGDAKAGLDSVRLKILLEHGIKSDNDGMSSMRVYVWLILLNAPVLKTDDYLALIHRGASPAYSKIRNDTFRTLTTDPLFRRRVSEASLIRLLNALAWKLHDAKEKRSVSLTLTDEIRKAPTSPTKTTELHSTTPTMKARARAMTQGLQAPPSSEPGIYVQGMNVLAAPFLYAARSEAEAFAAFHRFITVECPGYVRGAMDGVHRGLCLVDKVLAIVDPKLSMYLLSKNLEAKIYAFPSVLTLCACTPTLPEVLRLWDFLFAYGAHLNVLCIVAQLLVMRNDILTCPSPNKILRSFPPLNAQKVKEITLTLIKKIPDDVYAEIVAHAK